MWNQHGIDSDSSDTVNGYIEINFKRYTTCIPCLIKHLCLMYYHPVDRKIYDGLNIEFKYNNKNIIGYIGLCTSFDVRKEYNRAICINNNSNISPQSSNDLINFWFKNCKAEIMGDILTSGQYVTKIIEASTTPIKFKISMKHWLWISITCS